MYDPISPNVNFVEQEKKVEKFWRDEKIFEKSIEEKAKGTQSSAFFDKLFSMLIQLRSFATSECFQFMPRELTQSLCTYFLQIAWFAFR